jgi:hypothetical protein
LNEKESNIMFEDKKARLLLWPFSFSGGGAPAWA